MGYEIRLERRDAHPLAVVQRRARANELAGVVPEACGTVWNVVRTAKLTGAGRNVAVYLDDQLNLQVGVELDAPFSAVGDVVASTTPAGLVALTTHYGPYEQLGLAHQAIRAWCAGNGYALSGPNWEVYGHWQAAWERDPAQITTEVCYLLDSPDGLAN